MHERGHSEVPSFMCQATLMSSCPCFLSFWPISLHVPHFPQCHLTTLHRHHTPMRTMKWLVAHTRALESALGYATSHFRDYLFKLILFLGDLAPLTHITCTLVSPVGGPHSLGEIRGAAAVGKASAAARKFFARPLCSLGTCGYGANAGTAHRHPRSHGRWCGASFFKEILKALLCGAGAG